MSLQAGSYVICSEGKTTCDGTTWSPCVGDVVATKSLAGGAFGGGGLRLASLGGSTTCPSANACDPYCNQFVDTPGGLDASGLSTTEAGLAVTPPDNACPCNMPATPATVYSNLSASFKGNPASCTGDDSGVTTDNCNHDYQCVGGACAPYGVAGVNPSCGYRPDYTVGLGCHNGASWELEICNRGYVPSPSMGTLYVAIGSGTPTGTPSSCPTTPYPSGPQISGTASARDGSCAINLATTSIGAGQCINVNVASACTAQNGGAIDMSGDHWVFVNPSSTNIAGTPGALPVAECDRCNNFSAIKASGTGGPLGAEANCQLAVCGSSCGSGTDAGAEGGSGCHTYVSGTVYDPGGNIFLPGVAVYQPSGALTPFPAGVHCDSCTSVLSPYLSSTFSDLSGQFNLEVNDTANVPIVFQTGRWRRQITTGVLTPCAVNNITVAADCTTWPATNCLTRMPQNASEGDIPLTAVVTGSAEPFECSILKFMGGGQEMGPPLSGKRFQLFSDNGATIWNQEYHTGLKAAVTAISGSTATITGLTGMSPASVGRSIQFTGASKTKNNGTFVVSAYVSATSVKVTNTGPGVAGDANNGNIFWREIAPATVLSGSAASIDSVSSPNVTITGLSGLSAAQVNQQITISGALNPANNGMFPIVSVVNATTAVVQNPNAVPAPGSSGSSARVNSVSAGVATITGLSGMQASAVGKTLTLSGAARSGNNGSFTILSFISASSVTIQNTRANASDGNNGWISFYWGETNNGAISWTIGNIPDVFVAAISSQSQVNAFDEFVLQCGAGSAGSIRYLTSTQRDYFYNFLRGGGRLFFDHYSAGALVVPSPGGTAVAPFNDVSTWNSSIGSNKQQCNAKVAPGGGATVPHNNFKQWLINEGMAGGIVSTPQGVINEAYDPNPAKTFEWLRGESSSYPVGGDWASDPAGDISLIFSFDTNATGVVPTLLPDGGAGEGCGRAIYSGMHVDITRTSTGQSVSGTSGAIPNACKTSAALSPNEKAFEYLMFELSSCSIGGAPIIPSSPPAPPAPPPLVSTTFTRDFHATCAPGTAVVWQLFNWQAVIPSGTNIVFSAQTAPDVSGSPGTFGPLVPLGTASTTTATWTTQAPPCTVDDHLRDLAHYGSPARAECAGSTPPSQQISQEWLRVSMQFNPTAIVSPTLTQWQQLYDCVPNQ